MQRKSFVMGAGPAVQLPHAEEHSLVALEKEAIGCTRCDLYKNATQLVFGEGRKHASLMLVGEQPGEREDLEGRPFVGPAGSLLDKCLLEAGIDRDQCYVTNAVKHFKFTQRGKRRLHSKPNAGEIQRCAWWLGAEIDLVRPRLVVALGATALYALIGRYITITGTQGKVLTAPNGIRVLVTIHPSYVLRVRNQDDRERIRTGFIRDLGTARNFIQNLQT